MKLRINRNKQKLISNYTIHVRTTEARELGFLDENGESLELEKIIDLENNQIIIKKV